MLIDLTIHEKTLAEPNGDTRVLFENLRLTVDAPGATVAIMGRSGSGKTSLMRVLSGLDLDYSGAYLYDDTALTQTDAKMSKFRTKQVGIVTQRYDLLADRNTLDNVRIGAKRCTRTEAETALKLVGLPEYGSKRVNQLSGGEAQRVAIARALAKKPTIILADEPTGALDIDTEDSILRLLSAVAAGGTTIIYATHSPRVASSCGQVLTLADRQLRVA